jgi:hypothetical protein
MAISFVLVPCCTGIATAVTNAAEEITKAVIAAITT